MDKLKKMTFWMCSLRAASKQRYFSCIVSDENYVNIVVTISHFLLSRSCTLFQTCCQGLGATNSFGFGWTSGDPLTSLQSKAVSIE